MAHLVIEGGFEDFVGAKASRFSECEFGVGVHAFDGGSAATSRDILELWRRKCNKCEIAEEIAPRLTFPARPARSVLMHANLALPPGV